MKYWFVWYVITLCFFRPANVSLVILQALLDAKADPNVVDDTGRTALSWAVTNQPGEYVCFYLFESGNQSIDLSFNKSISLSINQPIN